MAGSTSRLEDELATLSAHMSAATARWLELAWEIHEEGSSDDLAGFLAYRCGITRREASEYLRVAEALEGLPVIRAAFSRGELTFTKVRALTRVATASCEAGLLELAAALTASQLERALRVFRRVAVAEARETHELEYVDYHFEEDGSLYLRARLAAEDGTPAREGVGRCAGAGGRAAAPGASRCRKRRGDERRSHERRVRRTRPGAAAFFFGRGAARAGRGVAHRVRHAARRAHQSGRPCRRCGARVRRARPPGARGRPGHCSRDGAPVGCDAELVAQIERDGLPVSAGRRRPCRRRSAALLEARDEHTCCFPGCERRRHLQAHHRRHWAHGGETSLDNLVLLCFHHHRLVHEGGYTIEPDPSGAFASETATASPARAYHGLDTRERRRAPRRERPPRARDRPADEPTRLGDPLDLGLAVWAIGHAEAA